jgi:hypothetical protein
MRNFVYALLAANLLFFGWARWLDVPSPARSNAADGAALQASAAKPGPPAHCLSLGPFTDANQVFTTSAALTARALNAQVRQLEHRVTTGWWVYVGGLASAGVRQGARQKLNQAGIHDVGSVPGELASDRISVGIFSEHDGALKRAAEVEAAHLTPTIEERQKTVAERWLNVEFQHDAAPPAPAELGVATGNDPPPTWVECPVPAASG